MDPGSAEGMLSKHDENAKAGRVRDLFLHGCTLLLSISILHSGSTAEGEKVCSVVHPWESFLLAELLLPPGTT